MAERGGTESRRPRSRAAEAGNLDFGQVLAIADSLPMIISFIDRDQIFRFVNRAAVDFFGRPRAEILGRRVCDVMPPAAYAARRPMIEAALAGERQWFAADYPHPDRGVLALQTDYVPRTDAEGQVIGVTVTVLDMTEQRIAERALKESEARFRRIADSAPVMIPR